MQMKKSTNYMLLNIALRIAAAWGAIGSKAGFLKPCPGNPLLTVAKADKQPGIVKNLTGSSIMNGEQVMTVVDFWTPKTVPWEGAKGSLNGSSGIPGGANLFTSGTEKAGGPGKADSEDATIKAVIEMDSGDQRLTGVVEASPRDAAVAIAEGLAITSGVPITRFVILLPMAGRPEIVSRCESTMSPSEVDRVEARYATKKNSTFSCFQYSHSMNGTDFPGPPGALIQQPAEKDEKEPPVEKRVNFEAGIFPATGVDGDINPAESVASDLVSAAQGSEEPVRVLHDDGNWTYQPSPTVKWKALLPGARAALMGQPFKPVEGNSLPLGPNPGGWNVPRPGLAATEQLSPAENLDTAEKIDKMAEKEDRATESSLEDMVDSMKRASYAHFKVMNGPQFEPYDPKTLDSTKKKRVQQKYMPMFYNLHRPEPLLPVETSNDEDDNEATT